MKGLIFTSLITLGIVAAGFDGANATRSPDGKPAVRSHTDLAGNTSYTGTDGERYGQNATGRERMSRAEGVKSMVGGAVIRSPSAGVQFRGVQLTYPGVYR